MEYRHVKKIILLLFSLSVSHSFRLLSFPVRSSFLTDIYRSGSARNAFIVRPISNVRVQRYRTLALSGLSLNIYYVYDVR